MKTLYIHVGSSKTGTTALQNFFWHNKEVFAKKGYCFDILPMKYPGKAMRKRNAHFVLTKARDENGTYDKETSETMIAKGYEVIGQWLDQYENVILTDESYWSYMYGDNWKYLDRFVALAKEHNANVKIIAYIRRQDEYMASWYKQHVREGGILTEWEEFVYQPPALLHLDYEKQLEDFAQHVGREHMIVRRYERGKFVGKEGNIYSDFMNAIGLELTEEFEIEQEEVHSSIGENYAEIMRILNQFIKKSKYVRDIKMSDYLALSAVECSRLDGNSISYRMFSQEQYDYIMNRYMESNERVRKEYFPQDENLFENQLSGKELWTKENSKMVEDIVLFFGNIAIRQKQENDELRARIKQIENKQKNIDPLFLNKTKKYAKAGIKRLLPNKK